MTIDLLEKGAHLHSDWSTISSSYPLITQFILETQILFFCFFFCPASSEIRQLIRDEINELGSPSASSLRTVGAYLFLSILHRLNEK